MFSHRVLVVGGGLAGLRAAIEARKSGEVAMISKVHPIRSHSVSAQGGINAALANLDAGDSWQQHAFDTIKGSDYLADQDAVEILCKEAVERVCELDHWGTPFSRLDDGRIAQRPFGGAGSPRCCYAADRTGQALLHTLFEQIHREPITFYNEWLVTDLVVHENRCRGVLAINLLDGEMHGFEAEAVIFATGGYGRVYRNTTNSLINTGSGIGMAYRAGVAIEDMEFVQFHPTTLLGSNILISEAARGEGGHLLNPAGKRFMQDYAPASAELAPRDIVARAMQTEINEGRCFEGGFLHLDLRPIGAKDIMARLPGILELADSFAGVDAIKEPIPVQPGQHYSMGGISVDEDGKSTVEGFYAAGECCCTSVHGANRLGGNSLLETLVFGKRAGQSAAVSAAGKQRSSNGALLDQALEQARGRLAELRKRDQGEPRFRLLEELRTVMTEKVGIFRNEAQLSEGLQAIRELKSRYKKVCLGDTGKNFNIDIFNTLELENMLSISEVIAAGALARKESRGSHYRTDFPRRDDANWLTHTFACCSEDGPQLTYDSPTITDFQPQAREY